MSARDVQQRFEAECIDPYLHLRTCGLVLWISLALNQVRNTIKLTLRPPHLILDPGGALAHGTSKLHGPPYSLIFSVMLTILAILPHYVCE